MISILGRLLVMAALLFAAFGATVGISSGLRASRRGLELTRRAALAFGASLLAANALMIWALWTNDFSVGYVAEVGSLSTPDYFKIPSLWASLNGSILFWGGVLGFYAIAFAQAHRDEHREYMPWALGVLLAVGVFFTLLIASIANPFHPVFPVPTDGPGPNPLLQNHWLMAFHPPALYLGYVGLAVPFAMASAALMAGRLEPGWMAPLRRWTLIPWAFLTIGIAMGGWWSYAVLGWGGYWAWDPVENASFLPWLTATATLHSALVTHRRGTMKTWTLSLVMVTFLLTLFGTFLTRSGVFNSVHSFTQSDIGPVFLVFIGVVAVFSIVLLATRDHVLEASDHANTFAGTGMSASMRFLRRRMGPMHPLGREFAVFLQNLVFSIFTFTVLLGTVFPLLVEAVEGRRLSVGEPYFNRMAVPLGLLLVALMGVGPAVPWGRLAPSVAWRRFSPPLFGGIAGGVLAVAMGFDGAYTIFAFFLCGFALVGNLQEFTGPVRARMSAHRESAFVAAPKVFQRARRRYGGHVAHFAVIMTVLSMTLSMGYKVEKDYTLAPGETAKLGDWEATFTGAKLVRDPARDSLVTTLVLRRDGKEVGLLEPRLNYFPSQREPVGTPAVHSTAGADFYVSLMQVEPDGKWASFRVMHMPAVIWLWIAMPIFFLSALIILWPGRRQAPRTVPAGEAEPA